MSGTFWNTGGGCPTAAYSGVRPGRQRARIQRHREGGGPGVWQRVAEDYAPSTSTSPPRTPGLAAIVRDQRRPDLRHPRVGDAQSIAEAAICGICRRPAAGSPTSTSSTTRHRSARSLPPTGLGLRHSLANNDTKDIAEAASHEVGHNFGLGHDGTSAATTGVAATTRSSYYCGHAMWAPIMGAGYHRRSPSGARASTPTPTTSPGRRRDHRGPRCGVRADEAGGTPAPPARRLAGTKYVTTASDQDVYLLGTCTGASPWRPLAGAGDPSPDLDIQLDLLDPPAPWWRPTTRCRRSSASISPPGCPHRSRHRPFGQYYVRVDGVGNGTGVDGYTDYASIGAYALTIDAGGSCTPGSGAPGPVRDLASPRSRVEPAVTWRAPADWWRERSRPTTSPSTATRSTP